ncbi:MAG TPA: hypothetical protein VHX63_15690 [Acidobacteriaceae bacterium]|nr:hypothetical protein [Acidobacteriaceae bacterium]
MTIPTTAVLEPVRADDSLRGQVAAATPIAQFLKQPWVRILGLTIGALFILGYHPFVDDAAIYVAGVEKIVSPSLFQQHSEYILPHLQHSLFSVGLGWIVRLTHAPLLPALFATYIFSLWLTLLACWRLSCQLFARSEARWGATTLLAVTMTLPVAGSALFFMDPYLTARSFSTPVILFALVFALQRRPLPTVLCLLLAVLLHPLMGAYAVAYVAVFWLIRDQRWRWLTGLTLLIFAGAFFVMHLAVLQHASAGYRAAALSRSYFFLNHWAWYEVFGLFPPLAAAWIFCARRNFSLNCNCSNVSATSVYVGAGAVVFSALFVHTSGPFQLASLQPLRAFHLIYLIFFLVLGSVLGQFLLRRHTVAWILCFGTVAAIMLTVQIRTYPDLAHVEWPWSTPQNPWEQAFLWIRGNTPDNSFFALDPRYQSLPHESTLGFRAAAERSALPDWSKDGGVAAIDPKIAPEWFAEATLEDHWSRWSDQERAQRLAPYHVDWVVLSTSRPTNLPCPYQNALVRVCQLSTETAQLKKTP